MTGIGWMIFEHIVRRGVLDCLSALHDKIIPPDFAAKDREPRLLGKSNGRRVADATSLGEFSKAESLALGHFSSGVRFINVSSGSPRRGGVSFFSYPCCGYSSWLVDELPQG
jgi:hypothetical protein